MFLPVITGRRLNNHLRQKGGRTNQQSLLTTGCSYPQPLTWVQGQLHSQLLPDLDGSRDVSPPDDTDDGRHGALSQHGGRLDVLYDVSPSTHTDNGRQGTLQGDDQDQVQLLYVHHGHRGQGGVLEGGGREK